MPCVPMLTINDAGGGLFVAVVYWYLFLVGDSNPITIDGDNFNMAGGPLTREHNNNNYRNRHDESDTSDSSHVHGHKVEQMV